MAMRVRLIFMAQKGGMTIRMAGGEKTAEFTDLIGIRPASKERNSQDE
jgi:hypothetical protein